MAACAADPVSTAKTNNNAVQVSLLFENDGCKVFRFMDDGEYHYYVVCQKTDDQPFAQSTMSKYSTGDDNTSDRHESIQTETR